MGALSPYRVIDLTTERAWLCGRLLADLGADVVKIEPPGGDGGRRHGRHARDTGDPDDSLTWWFQNRGKRSVVLDLDATADRLTLIDMVAGADVVLESFDPGWLEERDLGPDDLLAVNAGLVVTSVTPYGRTGPHAHHRAGDLTLAAASGMAWLNGETDRPPVRLSANQLAGHAGAEAAVHTLVALTHAAQTGQGQHVDVSTQLTGIRTLMNATGYPPLEGIDLRRAGPYNAYSRARFRMILRCADGHVVLIPSAGALGGVLMNGLVAWAAEQHPEAVPDDVRATDFTQLDLEALATDPDAPRFFDAVTDGIERLFGDHTKAELYAIALDKRMLLAPLNTAADLTDDDQLKARGYFVPVDQGVHGTLRYAGPWARLAATPLAEHGAPATIGQHTDEVRTERGRVPIATGALPAAPPPSQPGEPSGAALPLAGLKVWDMSWVGVGPLTARYLADYGATVVRLDCSKRPDVLRLAPPFKDAVPGINSSQFYADFNTSKLGLGLDMADERGRAIARRLGDWADVVVESFTPKTMRAWGLDHPTLASTNPSLVMLSTCMQGQTGPRAGYRGFGQLMAALSGFYEITGWPDRDPSMVYGAYTDFICQRFCATALIAAIDHRRRTGEGQHIDVAQYEAALQLLGPELLDHEVNGRVATRMGNRDLDAAPHGIYPTVPPPGKDEAWVAVAVEDDGEWAALREAMGDPDWAGDDRLVTPAGRVAAADELDDRMAEWTATLTADEVVARLQPRVAASPVHDQSALYTDPQIVHRGYFVPLDHTVMGEVPNNGMQATMSLTPTRPRKAAPCLGEDSWTILTEILGMDPDEVAALIAEGVVEMTG